MKKIGIILLSAVALIFACKKTEPDKPNPPAPVTPKIEIPAESQAVFSQGISIQAGTSSQSQTVKFTTTAAWSAEVADTKASTWLSVQPTSGSAGTVTMTVTAPPNTGTDAREASVTIKCGTVTKKFSVKQAGVPNVDVTEITLDKAELSLVEGQEAELKATVEPDDATDKTVTWTSSDEAIATVTDGKVKAVKAGTVTITAKAGAKEATCKVTVTAAVVPVESIKLDKESLEMVEGDKVTLTATVTPDNATDKTVTWTSSDEAIATVANGEVTAVKEGTATITAKAGDKSATCAVKVAKKVIAVTGIALDKTSVGMTEGEETQLTATVTPDNATDKTVTWTSDATAIATVDNTGKVKAIKEGSATITAKAGDKTATCTVTVAKSIIPVTSVTLDKTSLELVEGDEATLTATVKPDDATDKTVAWSTSDAAIVTVENGKVKAVKEGTATITAKAGEKSATCTVKVAKKVIAVTGITLDKTSVSLTKGEEGILTATVSPADATDKTVTWSSSDTKVATVENGKVKAVGGGNATITAKAGDKSATCAVKVTVPVTGITLDNGSVTLKEGQEIQLTANVAPVDASDKTVTWSCDKTDVVTVDNTGKVKAVKEGSATITAKAGDKSATCTVTVAKNVIAVTGVTLDKATLELTKGQEATLTATVSPADATDKTVTWSTSNSEVATVENGKVKAVGGGTATIMAKAGDKSATCAVTVKVPVESVTLDKTSLDMTEEDEVQLKATVKPDDASDKTVTWSSDKTDVATVDNTGKIKAIKEGTATITAKAGDKTATCAVKVAKRVVPATGISVDPSQLEVYVGEYKYVSAILTPSNSTDSPEWSTSNASIATVNTAGKVTGVAPGTATITAKVGEHSATCAVTVKAVIEVESITLSETTKSLTKEETFTLTATVTPDNATYKSITWKSDKPAVATVDANGKVTAVGGGEATITATAKNGKQATCTVTVTVPVNKVTLSPSGDLKLNVSESATLTASVDPSDATDKDITWKSGNESIATVVNGKVTAVAKGTTTITASAGGKSATINVEVTVPVESVSLSETTKSLTKGEKFTLTATVTPSNANEKTVSWSSNKPGVATVDANGEVTAMGAGEAIITASAGGKSATCTVTVTVPLNTISLNKTEQSVKVGESFTLTVSFDPTDATDKTVTWEKGNSTFITLTPSQDGLSCTVTGAAEGNATVTAKCGGKSATCAVTVVANPADNSEGYDNGGNGQWDN